MAPISGRRLGPRRLCVYSARAALSRRSMQSSERCSHLGREELGLLPRREVPALFDLMVVNELGVGFFGPASGRLKLFAREDGHAHRDLDPFGAEKAALVLPIETRRRYPRVRQP